MNEFLGIRTVLGRSVVALCCGFLLMKGGATFAQTTDTANSTPAESAAKEDVPSGGCMPMGLTASGEMVFPLQCKEFIERARGKTVEQRSVAPEPAAAPTSGKPADKPVDQDKPAETGSLPERVEHQNRVKKSDDCTHYRTYDPASGAYKGYDGRRRPCLARESNWRK